MVRTLLESERRALKGPLKRSLRRLKAWPPVGSVRFGQLRRDTPFSRTFGFDRGQPIDRFYIDDFLAEQAGRTGDGPARINGHVLEIGEDRYASRFARAGAIERLDILDVTDDNPQATIVADLTDGQEPAFRRIRLCHLHADIALDLRLACRRADSPQNPQTGREPCS